MTDGVADRGAILAALADLGGSGSPKDVAHQLGHTSGGRGYGAVRQMMWQMAQAGVLVRIGRGQYGLGADAPQVPTVVTVVGMLVADPDDAPTDLVTVTPVAGGLAQLAVHPVLAAAWAASVGRVTWATVHYTVGGGLLVLAPCSRSAPGAVRVHRHRRGYRVTVPAHVVQVAGGSAAGWGRGSVQTVVTADGPSTCMVAALSPADRPPSG